MVGCGRTFDKDGGEYNVLLGNKSSESDKFWRKYWPQYVDSIGIMHAPARLGSAEVCGFHNEFCKAFCERCARKHGIIW